jgi:hypothetical protein
VAGRKKRVQIDPNVAAFESAWRKLTGHPMFAPLLSVQVGPRRRAGARAALVDDGRLVTAKAIAVVDANGMIRASKAHRLDEEQWSWVLAHCLLHLGFGHLAPDRYATDPAYADVACLAVTRFQRAVKLGTEPLLLPADLPTVDESALLRQWRQAGVPAEYAACGTGGHGSDLVPPSSEPATGVGVPDWPAQFAVGLSAAATAAVDVAGGARTSLTDRGGHRPPWQLAMGWFLSSYPLLGALASRFTLVADADLARGWDITIAAVSPAAGEIYLNPLRHLSSVQWRFVLAHEMLHAALRHGDRVGARDPYLWNVAADYVINGWLIEMGVGEAPDGLLYDPQLAGMSAEAVYDQIARDIRRLRKLATLRGTGLSATCSVSPCRAPAHRRAGSTWTTSTGVPCWPATTTTSVTAGGICQPDSSPRSGCWNSRRCRGTPSSPAGSTSTYPPRSAPAPTLARPADRPARPTFRARAGGGPTNPYPDAPSVSSWTPPDP